MRQSDPQNIGVSPRVEATTRDTNMAEYADDKWKDDPKVVDDLVSRELMQLSLNDRNAIQEEIHGVHCLAKEETKELLEDSLKQLATELDDVLPPEQKKAYLISQRLKKSYVNDDDFRLRFLRCELFDAKKAARRIAFLLDFLLEVFGRFALKRPVKLVDFDREELKYMRRGRYQYLPFRDRSGRRIMTIFPGEDLETIPPITKVSTSWHRVTSLGAARHVAAQHSTPERMVSSAVCFRETNTGTNQSGISL